MADGLRFTRRSLLYGLTAAGSAGALVGAGTAALLRDDASFPGNAVAAGTLVVESEWLAGRNRVALDFTGMRPGETRVGTARVTLRGNPAWVWFGSSCPTARRGIEDAVDTKLTLYPGCDGRPVDVFGDYVTLREALDALADGSLLTDGVVAGGETVCVEFRVAMPSDRNGVPVELIRGDEIDVSFTFAAEQARNDVAPANPFAGGDCDDAREPVAPGAASTCDCAELGTVELPAAGRLAVGDRLPVLGGDDRPTDYALVVTDLDERSDTTVGGDPTREGTPTETLQTETATPEPTSPANPGSTRGNGDSGTRTGADARDERDRNGETDAETVGVAFSLEGPEPAPICELRVKSGREAATRAIDPPATTTPLLYGPDPTKAISHVRVSVCGGGV